MSGSTRSFHRWFHWWWPKMTLTVWRPAFLALCLVEIVLVLVTHGFLQAMIAGVWIALITFCTIMDRRERFLIEKSSHADHVHR